MSGPQATAQPVPVVLLAAGAGRRFGGIKQMAALDGEPMLRRVARAWLGVGLPVIVVTGAHAAQVEGAIADLPVHIERHAGWAAGMGSSLAAGFRRVTAEYPDAPGALLGLADEPLLDAALLQRMLARRAAATHSILVSVRAGVDGPPVLFPRDLFATLAAWPGARGARALLEREAHRVERFDTPNRMDVDTPADLERVREWLAAHRN